MAEVFVDGLTIECLDEIMLGNEVRFRGKLMAVYIHITTASHAKSFPFGLLPTSSAHVEIEIEGLIVRETKRNTFHFSTSLLSYGIYRPSKGIISSLPLSLS